MYGAQTWTLQKVDKKIPGKFWNVVLEKAGEYQWDWLCEKLKSITKHQGGEEYPTKNKKNEG